MPNKLDLKRIRERHGWMKKGNYPATIPLYLDDVSALLEAVRVRDELLAEIHAHVMELASAWQRGCLASPDGKNGVRSNWNRDLLVKIDEVLNGGK